MSSITRPLLAATLPDVKQIVFPILATPKLDGIRCLIVDGKAVSRSFKPIRNKHIRTTLEAICPSGLDGELVINGASFSEIQSAVNSFEGTPNFTYKVFDYVFNDDRFEPYLFRVRRLAQNTHAPQIEFVLPRLLSTLTEFTQYETHCVERGFEGVCYRDPNAYYKCGRSTLREQVLCKYKRFVDAEAVITGVVESTTNTNLPEIDALGLTHRSSSAAGKIPNGRCGALACYDPLKGWRFEVAGFTFALANKLWERRADVIGKIITYRYQDHGCKDAPRFPRFRGFRNDWDISS